jgi:oligopeptide/dipeptide ABC transporter ATP-binding protein
VIELEGVSKRFAGAYAVKQVTISIHKGEFVAVLGESGSGKTTLVKMINRLVEPDAGVVRVAGKDVRDEDVVALRRRIGYVIQHIGLLPHLTIADNVATVPRLLGWTDAAIASRVAELLALVGMPDVGARFPDQLSGGQRQRIGVARALALKPKLIVADEPVSALDVSIQAQILNLLSQLQDELGLTIVFIAHDLSVVRHMCDRVAVMYLGTIVELADNETLYTHPRHPYTGALLSAVPVADPHEARSKKRQILGGDVPSPTNPPKACRFHTRCPKAQERCWTETPALERKESGGLAACHFPLTDAEAADRIPAVAEAYSSSSSS